MTPDGSGPVGADRSDLAIDPQAGLSKDESPWPSTDPTAIEFKRQVAQEFLAGETLHGLANRHDLSRNLIRLWVQKYEAGALTKTPPQPTFSSNMRLGSRPSNGSSASRRWNWSF
jgi:hypothetical protein